MKLSAIIKELQRLDSTPANLLETTIEKESNFNRKLLELAGKAINSMPKHFTQTKISKMTGLAQSTISCIKNERRGRRVSSNKAIEIMFKLGYSVEIKFTRIEK